MTEWQTYEEVSKYIIDKFSSKFGLKKVKGKQKLVGASGTEGEVDAFGIREDKESTVIIEARRYTSSKQNQEKLGSLAYRIIDLGADGGIIVSPLGLQRGAEKIANANKIVSVELDADSTINAFTVRLFGDLFIGVPSAKIVVTGYPPTVRITKQNDD